MASCGSIVGIRDLVGSFGHDRHLAGEAVLQALHVLLAHAVVLIEDGDLAAGLGLQQKLRKNLGFSRVARQKAHGPRKLARLVPGRRARQGEKLRHLFRVQIGLDRGVGVGADGRHRQENLVLLDELARHLHGLVGIVGVVIDDEIELAAVDAALGVDLVRIGRHDLGDDAVGRGRTGQWGGDANADFVAGRRRCVHPGGQRRTCHHRNRQRHRSAAPRGEEPAHSVAGHPPGRLSHTPMIIEPSPHCSPLPSLCDACCASKGERSAFQRCSPTLCPNRIDFVTSLRVLCDMVSQAYV